MLRYKFTNIHRYYFARNRIRQQIKFDPKLKKYTATQEVSSQVDSLRQQYQQSEFHKNQFPNKSQSYSQSMSKFSTIINNKDVGNTKLKLGHRFSIDEAKLNKKIKKVYNEQIDLKNIQTHDSSDLNYLDQGKSHLNDNVAEIQFEENFSRQLFRNKETKRLISKQENNFTNYLTRNGQVSNPQFQSYEQAKLRLKNNRIKNMMNVNRNNEQLQLLIESGVMNDPTSLALLIEEINSSPKKQQNLDNAKSIQSMQTNIVTENQHHIIPRHSQINDSANAMEELQDYTKIDQFRQNYQEMHDADKQSCQQDLQLLKQIRDYENKTFLNRYKAINFRFKGRVKFDFFREQELISYIKNEEITPVDLLQMYDQNKHQISRFNHPVITPAVLSTIYSRTSLYRFPETDKNNRINMLNDKLFQKIERQTFMKLNFLNDNDFCSAVYAYSHNHEQEQGVLTPKVAQKINICAFQEFKERIVSLSQQNLGLVLRSLSKMPVLKYESLNFQPVIQHLDQCLSQLDNMYTFESCINFLVCLPASNSTFKAVSNNIQIFQKYKWQQIFTLNSFIYASGFLLKYCNQNSLSLKHSLRQILIDQSASLKSLLPQCSISFLPYVITALRETDAIFELKQIVNLSKKQTVDVIHQQKQLISQNNIVNLTWNFALTDVAFYMQKKMPKYATSNRLTLISNSDIVTKLTNKILLPFQALPFNSSLYFVYHDLAKFVHDQIQNISALNLAKILEGLAVVNYKNQTFHDEVCQKVLRLLQNTERQSETVMHKISQTANLQAICSIISSYGFQRLANSLYKQYVAHFFAEQNLNNNIFSSIPKNLLLRTLTIISALQYQTNEQQQKVLLNIVNKYIMPYVHLLSHKQKSAVKFIFLATYPLLLDDQSSVKRIQVIDRAFQALNNKDQAMDREDSLLQSYFNQFKNFYDNLRKQQKSQMLRFEEAEGKLHKFLLPDMLKKQEAVGCALNYNQVSDKIYEMLCSERKKKCVHKSWRIEIPEEKEVILIVTYDHLMSYLDNDKDPKVMLFGIWGLYRKIYQKLGWKVKLICSFLEG